jgi:hypothetical protein
MVKFGNRTALKLGFECSSSCQMLNESNVLLAFTKLRFHCWLFLPFDTIRKQKIINRQLKYQNMIGLFLRNASRILVITTWPARPLTIPTAKNTAPYLWIGFEFAASGYVFLGYVKMPGKRSGWQIWVSMRKLGLGLGISTQGAGLQTREKRLWLRRW